jgi:putative ATP-binding cassette transporter
MHLLGPLQRVQGPLLWTAVLAGGASGLATGALAAVIHQALADPAQMADRAAPFTALCAAAVSARVGSQLALVRHTQRALRELRLDLAQRLLATPLARLDALGKPHLLALLTDDIASVAHALERLPALFANAALLLACTAYLVWLAGALVLPLAAFALAGALSFHWLEGRASGAFARSREQPEALHRRWRGLVEGTKELQLSAPRRAAFLSSVLGPATGERRDSFSAGPSADVWAASWAHLLFCTAIGFALFALARWSPQPGQVWIGFALALLFIIRPLGDLTMALPVLRRAAIALGKIDQLSSALQSAPSREEAPPPTPAQPQQIELTGVRFRYPAEHDDRPFELGPIDLVLRPGEIVFIAGGNGSGKSTLGLLIAGLYTPCGGRVRCGGRDIASEREREAYRQQFSAVFAEFHVFEELLVASGAQLEAAARYLDRLGVAHRVRVQDGRLSTLALSSGQRKRLALVAAYLEERAVYLFDEWAADQDPEFKRVFYTELLPELKARRKTVVAITHDEAYFECADRLLRMECGRITADGPPPRPQLRGSGARGRTLEYARLS